MNFPSLHQRRINDCGPITLMMIAKYYGIRCSYHEICEKCNYTNIGVSLLDINVCAQMLKFNTLVIDCSIKDLVETIPVPVIAYFTDGHFVAIYKTNKKYIWISDPAIGHVRYDKETFTKKWYSNAKKSGVILLIEK